MPAYNAATTLRKTYDEVMEQEIADLVILVDDASHDTTSAIALGLPRTKVFVHERNKSYRDGIDDVQLRKNANSIE